MAMLDISSRHVVLASIAVLTFVLAFLPAEAIAGHHVNEDYIFVPYAGRWANASDSETWPSNHHIPYGGDWSVDYYASSGTRRILWGLFT